MSGNTRTEVLDHKETKKHVEEPKATAKGHGIDRSMVAQGTHQGHGGPKAQGKVSAGLAEDETTALDDERGTN